MSNSVKGSTGLSQTDRALPTPALQIFTAELSLNLFAHWFWPFFSSGWHLFDFFVVTSEESRFVPPCPTLLAPR